MFVVVIIFMVAGGAFGYVLGGHSKRSRTQVDIRAEERRISQIPKLTEVSRQYYLGYLDGMGKVEDFMFDN